MAKNYAKFVPPKSRSSRKKQWRTEVVVAVFLLCGGAIAFGSFLYVERAQEVMTSSDHSDSGPSVFAKFIALIHHKKATTVDPKLASNKKAAAASSDQPPGVHFDFYNELPNMQMPADEQAGAMNTPSPAPRAASQEHAAAEPAPASELVVVEAKPVAPVVASAAPLPLPAKLMPAVPKPVVAKAAAPKSPARIFNPDEVTDLLAAEHGVQRYVIQLGVFQSEAAANRLREAIVSVGFEAAIVKVTQGNHKIYHVQQGPYESAALAKSSQQRLEKRGIISVIQKVSV
jgi:cell division protein FtsN